MSHLDPKTILLLCLLQASLMGAGNSQQATPLDFAGARQRLVEQLSGPGRNIKNRRVLDAVATVPRHEFVPEPLRKFAYLDEPLPIGYYQSISQPYIVAFMTEQLDRPIGSLRLVPGPATRPRCFHGWSLKSIRSRLLNLSPNVPRLISDGSDILT